MLAIHNARSAMDWYQKNLGAQVVMQLVDPQGQVVHGEMKIGEAFFMVAEENPAWNSSPQTLQATTVVLNLLVDDPDTLFQQALQAGATTIFPLADQFYGYRAGRLQDPFGHQWILAKQIEQVSPEEMQRRMDQMFQ
jgi:PhnB protein